MTHKCIDYSPWEGTFKAMLRYKSLQFSKGEGGLGCGGAFLMGSPRDLLLYLRLKFVIYGSQHVYTHGFDLKTRKILII